MQDIRSAPGLRSGRFGLLLHPATLITLTVLLAFGGALLADFYMDDYGFVVNSKGTEPAKIYWMWFGVRHGDPDFDAMPVSVFQLIPTLIFELTGKLFPLNSAASHAWNLAIHCALALAVCFRGRRLLDALDFPGDQESRRRAALLGGLVFACHPLGSEGVYYAKCVMIQLVALFGFLAAARAAEFARAPSVRGFLLAAGAVALTMFSYFPGTAMAGAFVALVTASILTGRRGGKFMTLTPRWKQPLPLAGIVVALGVTAWVGWWWMGRLFGHLEGWAAVYDRHFVTQGRVFWEYVRRVIVPTDLVSDHYQPWSMGFGDTAAAWKTAAFLGLFTAALFAALRARGTAARGVGLLLTLAVTPFLLRLLYVNIEIMVEYRAYPAMPWIALLLGCGLSALWGKRASAGVAATALALAWFCYLSGERGKVWRSGRALAENVLASYPWNNRARTQLQSLDYDEGDYAAVLRRHDEILAARRGIDRLNDLTSGRTKIDTMRADDSVIDSFQWAIYARAELKGPEEALRWADEAIAGLRRDYPDKFEPVTPGDPRVPGWPVLVARDAVEKARQAGVGAAPVK